MNHTNKTGRHKAIAGFNAGIATMALSPVFGNPEKKHEPSFSRIDKSSLQSCSKGRV